ncbi:MAG: tRNA lysidine(34) synthetase TilS [Gemmatimonadales bacterium]|nr:tRNA lysidine(34) synthetase TilS [Gemmatimonadales bacterium]
MSRSHFIAKVSRRLDELIELVFSATRHSPDSSNGGILVALSGGPDSVALLLAACHWAKETGRPVVAAHLNHQLRGEQADSDARFCAELCATRSVQLHLHEQDPRPVARSRGLGLEEAGRHLRRRFFRSLLDDHPELLCVATGHHRDDQAETVVMRLFRGTGPDGLRGIRPLQGQTIHPLLEISRREILAFLEQENQPWRLDPTNMEGDNTRSRVRRELLPLARDIFGPGSDQVPARLAELLGPDQDLLDGITERTLGELSNSNGQGRNPSGQAAELSSLAIGGLLELEPAMARRVLLLWLKRVRSGGVTDIEMAHVANIFVWLREGSSGSRLDLPGQAILCRDFDSLRLQEIGTVDLSLRSAADYRIQVSRTPVPSDPVAWGLREGAGGVSLSGGESDPESGSWNLTCPASVLKGNLKIRNWRNGDRFQPFGLNGSRKLSDLLREHRIPANRREGILLVEDDAGILWIVGIARSERTRLLPSTGQTVTISVIKRY